MAIVRDEQQFEDYLLGTSTARPLIARLDIAGDHPTGHRQPGGNWGGVGHRVEEVALPGAAVVGQSADRLSQPLGKLLG